MEDKVIVSVWVPSISWQYDMQIPLHIPLDKLLPLILRVIRELNESFCPSDPPILCHSETMMRMEQNITLKQYGIKNGDQLVLF